jgi:hypothetical protein
LFLFLINILILPKPNQYSVEQHFKNLVMQISCYTSLREPAKGF